MALTQSFSNMINEYVRNPMLQAEMKKRQFIFNQCEEDKTWKLGNYIVPFNSATASSVKFGSLTATNDVSESKNVRGVISAYAEMTSTMVFNYKDLMVNDKISVDNFLRILPDQLDAHLDLVKNIAGQNFMAGKGIEKLTANGTAGGLATVANPERYEIDQKVEFASTVVTTPIVGYIKTIDLNTGVLTIVSTRSGVTAVALNTLLVADSAKIYVESQGAGGFTSIPDILLPSGVSGAPANIYGVAKTSSKYTQSIAQDGSAFTASDLLKNLFKHYVKTRKVGAGKPSQLLTSYNNYAACVNQVEVSKGAFNVIPMNSKAELHAWDNITIGGFMAGGQPITMVALPEMNDDLAVAFDKSTFKIASNGGMKKMVSPDGLEFYTDRTTNGYKYYVDFGLSGDLVCNAPSKNGIVYGLNITY